MPLVAVYGAKKRGNLARVGYAGMMSFLSRWKSSTKVCGRVARAIATSDAIAEYLTTDLQNTVGGFQGSTFFYAPDRNE